MATPISTVDLYNAYLAYFGRPPEPEGLAYYSDKTEAQVLASFSASQESQDLLVGTNLADSINNVYLNLFNRDADVAGLNYWIGQIAGGTFTLAEAAMAILRGAQGDDLETVTAKNDAMVAFVAALDTTAEIIGYSGMEAAASARNFIATVGFQWTDGEVDGPISVPSSEDIDAAVAAATTPGAIVGEEYFLGVTQDHLSGNIANDSFIADVMQNPMGAQVNSLATGDRLDGNEGTDRLDAQVTEGANYGGLGAPIQPRTTSIEIVKLEALNSEIGYTGESIGLDVNGIANSLIGLIGSLDTVYNGTLGIPGYIPLLAVKPLEVATTEVYVNAKDMTDVTQMWSWYSDANLTVQNMTTLDENGNMRNLEDMTIGMGYSGNKDSHWNESDYHVYFDQDYLVPGQTYNNQAFYWLLDQDAELVDAPELDNINVDGFLFKVGDGPMLNLQSDAAVGAKTWAGFVAALQAPLQAMIDAGMVPADTTLTLDPTNVDYTFLDDGSQSGPIPAMVIGTKTNTIITPLGFSQVEDAIGEFNVYGRFNNDSASATDLLAIGVALEKVGLAGDGGELVIGSMDKTECNVWTEEKAGHGIQQFNVTVYGNEAKSSSLAGLHSTNNNLEKVVVTTGAAAGLGEKDYADLTIGNSNTRVPVVSTIDLTHALGGTGGLGILGDTLAAPQEMNYGSGALDADQLYQLQILNDKADCFDCDDVFSGALKDVQTFDSTAFLGDLTLFASLTSEVTAKYLDLQDTQDNPAADNVEFDYVTGVGDDYVALTVSANNYADAGAATREDFALVINSGAGNDQVVLSIVDCDGEDDSVGGFVGRSEDYWGSEQFGFDNWYDNQALNKNLTIVTGTGNDVVRTGPSGNFIIDTGADNDTVYLQNDDDKAVWVYNTITDGPLHTEITNLQSDANNSYKLYDATVTVQYRHLTATVALPNTNGITTDLQVNQAIKKAINSDPVLSKLLVANDGPANTLVVRSLIDGDETDDFGLLGDELSVTLNVPKVSDLTVGEVSQLATWWNMPGATASSLVAFMDTQKAAFDARGDYDETFATHAGFTMSGDDSDGTSDNHVTLGTGNDVAVLGTGWLSNDTVIYDKPAFGNDVIVNFVTSEIETSVETLNVATVYVTHQGTDAVAASVTPGVAETFTLEVTAAGAAGGTITFNGGTVTIAAGMTMAQVVAAFVTPTTAYTQYTASAGATPGIVTFTQTSLTGDLTDSTVANFVVGQPTLSGVLVAVVNGADGSAPVNNPAVAATKETFTVTFGQGDTDTSYLFDGEEVPTAVTETGVNIASAAEMGNYTNWVVTGRSGNVVTFEAKTAGVVADVTDASWVNANIKETVIDQVSYASSDFLDFTGLGGKGSQFAGTAVSETNGSITVQALSNANDTAAEIAALYTNDSATQTKHIFITYKPADQGFGNVWQVVDAAGTGTGSTTATLMGTIDLADTPWSALTAYNFV